MQKSLQCYKYKVLFKAYQFSWSVFCCAEWFLYTIYVSVKVSVAAMSRSRSRLGCRTSCLGLGLLRLRSRLDQNAQRLGLVSVSDLCVSGLVSVSAWKVSCTSLLIRIVPVKWKLPPSSSPIEGEHHRCSDYSDQDISDTGLKYLGTLWNWVRNVSGHFGPTP